MDRIPHSPSTSFHSCSSHSSEALDDTAQSVPGNPVPALQPPPMTSNILGVMRGALSAFQGAFQLPSVGLGWVLPRIPQPEAGGSTTSAHAMDPSVTNWLEEAGTPDMRASRATAAQHLQEVLQGKEELVLNGLALGTLPDIFDRAEVKEGLRSVRLNDCRLDTLPASLLQLPRLEILSVQNAGLSHLPEFGEMPGLLSLNLSHNRLTELPESIGRMGSPLALILDRNRLEFLPESIGRLTALRELTVPGNRLHGLSDSLGDLLDLEKLDVGFNRLSDLPESLGRLPLEQLFINGMPELREIPPVVFAMASLEELRLNNTALASVPLEIGQLSNLQYLDLSECRITSIAEEIGQLPETCNVELSGNPLPRALVDRLRHAVGGPQIHVGKQATQSLETNIAGWLKDLSREQVMKWQRLANNVELGAQVGEFNSWLEAMRETADYRNEKTRPHLEHRMQSLLEDLTRMLENIDPARLPRESPLPTYLEIARDAVSRCEDRALMGLDGMELQQVSERAGRGEYDDSQLIALGREMFIRDQISLIAEEKAKELPKGDDEEEGVEVHLTYLVGLRDQLGLTLGSQDLLYSSLSEVDGEDLKRAAQEIRQQLDTPGVLRTFLADWEPIRQLVNQRHPAEWRNIEKEFEALEDQAYGQDGNTDWAALAGLGVRREQAFRELCANKVEELLKRELPSASRDPEEPAAKRARLD